MNILVGLVEQLLLALIHLAVIGIDVVFFFVVIRSITIRWPQEFLLKLDYIGSPMVESLCHAVGRPFHVISVHGRLLLLAIALMLCRLSLLAILQPFI